MKRWLVAVLLITAAINTACSEEETMPSTIQEVKARNSERLLELPGVVSVGIGKNSAGEPAIIIGLDGPRPETFDRLPTELEGYSVHTRILGQVRAQ